MFYIKIGKILHLFNKHELKNVILNEVLSNNTTI